MLDAYVLFPVGAMRHFEAITIAVRFFMLVCNIHFILLLLSLLWLASTGSSLGSLRIFTEFQCERLLNTPLAPSICSWTKYTLVDLRG